MPVTPIRAAIILAVILAVIAARWDVGVWRHLEGHVAVAIPVVEVTGGEVGGAPVAGAGLAGLLAVGVAAQVLAEATRATRQPAPATLRLRRGVVSGGAIGRGSEAAQ